MVPERLKEEEEEEEREEDEGRGKEEGELHKRSQHAEQEKLKFLFAPPCGSKPRDDATIPQGRIGETGREG